MGIGVASVLVACGGSQPVTASSSAPEPTSLGYTAEQAMAQMLYFRDLICACKDRRCGEYGLADLKTWGREFASQSPARRGWVFTEYGLEIVAKLDAETKKCLASPGTWRPAPQLPQLPTVALAEFNAHILAGGAKVVPDDADRRTLLEREILKVVTTIELCVDTAGNVSGVRLLSSSGLPDYEAKIQRELATWRYAPFTIDGQLSPACSTITFVYKPEAPEP